MKQTKKKFYQLLVSTSLLSSALALPMVTMQAVYANSGTFTVGGAELNVRRAPSTTGEIVAEYQPGQVVEYDSIVEGDGYRWISYVGASGNRNYVAIGRADGSQSFGTLSGETPTTPSNQTSTIDVSTIVGTWVNAQGDKLTISSDGRFTGNTIFGYLTDAPMTPNEARGNYYSRDKGYFQYTVGSSGFIYDSTSDEIYVYTHSDAPWGSRTDFLYSRETAQTTTSTKTEDIKDEDKSDSNEGNVVKAKPRTGPNPYKDYLSELTRFDDIEALKGEVFDYALFDIDGNGTPELIVGKPEEQWIQAVYTLVDDKPHKITQLRGKEAVNSYHGSIYLYDSGKIALQEYSTGSKTYANQIFQLEKDNKKLAEPIVESGQIGDGKATMLEGLARFDISGLDWKEVTEEDSVSATSKNKTTTNSTEQSQVKKETTASEKTSTTGKESSSNTSGEGNPIQKLYKTITRRKTLPSTGEAVSVLGAIGLGILAVVGLVLKKRKK